jgi:hypothetical protein
VDADDEVFITAIEDIINDLEWESPSRWAPVIERLRQLVDEWRTQIARRTRGETAAASEPPGDEGSAPPA